MSARAIGATAVLLAGVLAACASSPESRPHEMQAITGTQQVRTDVEPHMLFWQVQGGTLSIDPELNEYVRRVGQRLARASDRELPFEFVVLNNSVPNAWALPGGKIAVSRGLLQDLSCEAELAAVLGHELPHSFAPQAGEAAEERGGALTQEAMRALRNGVRDNPYAELIIGDASSVADLAARTYGREEEREADRQSMLYMKRAGYDPTAAVELQRAFMRVDDREWFAAWLLRHPPARERVTSSKRTLAEVGAGGERGCESYADATARLRQLQPAYEKYDAGVNALRKGDPDVAEANAREALAIESREPKFHELLGDVALAREAYEEAIRHFQQARDLNPEYFKPYLGEGIARRALGQRDDAAKLLDRSMNLLPTATGAYYLGLLAQDSGELQQAVNYFQLAAQSDSDLGRTSARRLIELDLPRNPGRYVHLEPRLDRSGRVWIRVQNQAPISVGNVVVAAALANPGGGLRQGPIQVGTGGRTLEPNEVVQVATPLGPLPDSEALRLVRAQVEGAHVVR